MSQNKYTTNNNHTLVAVSNADGETPVYLWADPSTHGLVVSATISSAGIATSTNQTNGSQLTQIVDAGGDAVTVTGGKLDVNATASLAGTTLPISSATTAVGVAIVDSSGNQISSFGGGTQYAEGATTLPATGTVGLSRVVSDFSTYPESSLNVPISDIYGRLTVNVGQSQLDSLRLAYAQDMQPIPSPTPGGIMTLGNDNGTARYFKVDSDGATVVTSSTLATESTVSTLALESGGNLATIAGKDFATQTTLAALNTKVTAVNTGAVVVSSSALPTGAATSAKQPALGTAGSASADVITVQGVASMTALKVDGSAVTQPVSLTSTTITGTVAATQSGTWTNTVTQATASNLNATVVGTGTFATQATLAAETTKVIGTVNQGTSPWVTSNATTSVVGNGAAATAQRVTLANDSTGIIATVGAVTAITNALPAGTNAIGKLAPNSGVDIGDVDITSVTPGTTATSLGKAEDSPHTTGDVGVMPLAVRNDNGAVLAGSDGDYLPLTTDSTGALRVDLNGTVSTNNSTTSVLSANAVFTGTWEDVMNYNEICISVIASHVSATDGLSIQQSSDGTNVDLTDTYTIPAATAKTYSVPRQARYFRVVYTNGATLQTSFRLQTILNRLGTKASSQRAGDGYTNETDLEQEQAFLMGYNGTTWDRVRTVGTGVLSASAVLTAGAATVGSIASITTSIVPGTGATNLGKAEDAAASSGDTGVPVFGVRNDALTAAQTSSTGDYGSPSIDTSGILMTAGAPRLLKARQVTTLTASTAETTIVTAIASTFNDIYGLILSNTSATATEVTIRDATAGGTISSLMVPAGDTRGFMLPLDSAVPQATVNNNWTAQCSASVTSLKVTALYVKRV